MEPYKAKLLPIPYKLDRETIKLLGQANDKYGQYKSLLKMFKFDQKYFLDSLVLGESIRSSRIEGTQISQDDMYYINYKESNDSIKEVRNLKQMLEYANENLKSQRFSTLMINSMHQDVEGKNVKCYSYITQIVLSIIIIGVFAFFAMV